MFIPDMPEPDEINYSEDDWELWKQVAVAALVAALKTAAPGATLNQSDAAQNAAQAADVLLEEYRKRRNPGQKAVGFRQA